MAISSFLDFKNLGGKLIDGYRFRLKTYKVLRKVGWLDFEIWIGRRLVFKGIASSGGKGIKPWLDLNYMPLPGGGPKNLEKKLFKRLGKIIPPGGHIMVSYEGEEKFHLETKSGLDAGIPAVLTPIGFLIFSGGFQIVKDWYLPEGGYEGPRKLWGEKAPDSVWAKKFRKETARQVKDFLRTKPGPNHKELDAAARERSREILRITKLNEVQRIHDKKYQ